MESEVLPFVRKEKCGDCVSIQGVSSPAGRCGLCGGWRKEKIAYYCNTNKDKEWRKLNEPACPLFQQGNGEIPMEGI